MNIVLIQQVKLELTFERYSRSTKAKKTQYRAFFLSSAPSTRYDFFFYVPFCFPSFLQNGHFVYEVN